MTVAGGWLELREGYRWVVRVQMEGYRCVVRVQGGVQVCG